MPDSITSQETAFFLVATMKTSKPMRLSEVTLDIVGCRVIEKAVLNLYHPCISLL
jgi:hypothetical protein